MCSSHIVSYNFVHIQYHFFHFLSQINPFNEKMFVYFTVTLTFTRFIIFCVTSLYLSFTSVSFLVFISFRIGFVYKLLLSFLFVISDISLFFYAHSYFLSPSLFFSSFLFLHRYCVIYNYISIIFITQNDVFRVPLFNSDTNFFLSLGLFF